MAEVLQKCLNDQFEEKKNTEKNIRALNSDKDWTNFLLSIHDNESFQ